MTKLGILNECHLVADLNYFYTATHKKRQRMRDKKRELRQTDWLHGWLARPPGCTWRWPQVWSPQDQTAEACRRIQQRAAAAGRWLGTWPAGSLDQHRWPAAGEKRGHTATDISYKQTQKKTNTFFIQIFKLKSACKDVCEALNIWCKSTITVRPPSSLENEMRSMIFKCQQTDLINFVTISTASNALAQTHIRWVLRSCCDYQTVHNTLRLALDVILECARGSASKFMRNRKLRVTHDYSKRTLFEIQLVEPIFCRKLNKKLYPSQKLQINTAFTCFTSLEDMQPLMAHCREKTTTFKFKVHSKTEKAYTAIFNF